MKKALNKCLLFILIIISIFTCACNTEPADTSNNNNQEVVTPEEPPEEITSPTAPEEPPTPQPELKSFDITIDNYTNYLDIQITQSSQTSTLINALYRIKYIGGAERDVWGLNPNLSIASSCKLIKTQYSITTTFNVFVAPTQTKYQYSGVMILVKYKNSSTSVIIDEFGRGTSSFILIESMYNRTGYDYTVYPESAVASIVGGVYYYE